MVVTPTGSPGQNVDGAAGTDTPPDTSALGGLESRGALRKGLREGVSQQPGGL